ncbi:putative transcription factor TGA like domain-containing protein [Helianthus debilis subsp. tardiflorus]
MTFADFFERWEGQHRIYLDKLLQVAASESDDDAERESLVQQVLTHYQEYYDEKSIAAESDIFLMFSPPWLSSYERTLLWVTGFKPSVSFRLVKQSVGADLNEEQLERIAAVKEETRRMEGQIAQALARVQESVAAPTFCELVKREGSLVDGDMENAMGALKVALLRVMRDADALRQQTGLQVLKVLSPAQKLKFLAGTSRFWLLSRRLGMERDPTYTFHPEPK